jgi:hypothetical protein
MKIVKVIAIAVLILIALIGIVGLIVPSKVEVKREIEVETPSNVAHEYLRKLSNFHQWSPWTQMDPEIKYEIHGEDGHVGSEYAWYGEGHSGKGVQRVTEISGNRIDIDVIFEEPHEGKARTYFLIEQQSPDITKISWGMESRLSFPFNIIAFFSGFKGEIESQYDMGLKALKEQLEGDAGQDRYLQYHLHKAERPVYKYLALREKVPAHEIPAFISASTHRIMEVASQNTVHPSGVPIGIIDRNKIENDLAEVVFAIPFEGEIESTDNIEVFELKGNTWFIEYIGNYQHINSGYRALKWHLERINIDVEKGQIFEEYLAGHEAGGHPDIHWHINLWFVKDDSPSDLGTY